MNIQEEYTAGYFTIQSNTTNLQSLFSAFLNHGDSLASHVSGVECFEAIYASHEACRTQKLNTTTRGFQQQESTKTLLSIRVRPLLSPSGLGQPVRPPGSIKIRSDSTQIYCLQYEGSKTIASAAQIPSEQPAFSFDIVQGGHRRADLISKKSQFIQRILSAVPTHVTSQQSRGR